MHLNISDSDLHSKFNINMPYVWEQSEQADVSCERGNKGKRLSYAFPSLLQCPPLRRTLECVMTREKRAMDRKKKGWGLVSATLSVSVKKRSLCSQVSYAFVTMPEGGRGGGGGG